MRRVAALAALCLPAAAAWLAPARRPRALAARRSIAMPEDDVATAEPASTKPPKKLKRVARSARPTVAVIGRPNVGKSTLVNRFCDAGRGGAIAVDEVGVTRDRVYQRAEWCGRVFDVVDTGGLLFEDDESSAFLEEIREQARRPRGHVWGPSRRPQSGADDRGPATGCHVLRAGRRRGRRPIVNAGRDEDRSSKEDDGSPTPQKSRASSLRVGPALEADRDDDAAAATRIFGCRVTATPRPRRGSSVAGSRRRRGDDADGPRRRARRPRPRRGSLVAGSRRRRGRDADGPRRRAAATSVRARRRPSRSARRARASSSLTAARA